METKFVHIGKRADGQLVGHTDLEAMKSLDGVTKVLLKVPIAEYEAASGLIREIDGKIFLGKTDAEKKADKDQARIIEIDRELSDINFKQTRSSAEITNALASGKTPDSEAVKIHKERETKADALRKERAKLIAA